MSTILIADDDRVFTELLRTKLCEKGFQVLVAFDAMQAMMAAVKWVPDAILLDVKMPAGTGIAALRHLKASNQTSAIPIIAVSALETPTLPRLLKRLGAIAFLPKPVNFKTVYKMIRILLSLRPERAAGEHDSVIPRIDGVGQGAEHQPV
jgi:two-component system, cell cycle response regulator DivK